MFWHFVIKQIGTLSLWKNGCFTYVLKKNWFEIWNVTIWYQISSLKNFDERLSHLQPGMESLGDERTSWITVIAYIEQIKHYNNNIGNFYYSRGNYI